MAIESKIGLGTPAIKETTKPEIVRQSMVLSREDYDLHLMVANYIPGELGSHSYTIEEEGLPIDSSMVAVVYEGTGHDVPYNRLFEALKFETDYAREEGKSTYQTNAILDARLRVEISREQKRRDLVRESDR